MTDEFFNYKKYVFDSPSESSPDDDIHTEQQAFSSVVLFMNEDLTEDAKSKLSQILKAIKLTVEDCTVIHGKASSVQLNNALDSQKVMDIICFGRPNDLNDTPLNEATQLSGKNIFITYALSELTEEEQNGQVTKRKALWSGLKAWRLK